MVIFYVDLDFLFYGELETKILKFFNAINK